MQLGVDTHKQTHVLVALDDEGRQRGTRATPNTPEGWAEALAWARGHHHHHRYLLTTDATIMVIHRPW